MTRFCEEILGYLVELEDRIIRGLGIPAEFLQESNCVSLVREMRELQYKRYVELIKESYYR